MTSRYHLTTFPPTPPTGVTGKMAFFRDAIDSASSPAGFLLPFHVVSALQIPALSCPFSCSLFPCRPFFFTFYFLPLKPTSLIANGCHNNVFLPRNIPPPILDFLFKLDMRVVFSQATCPRISHNPFCARTFFPNPSFPPFSFYPISIVSTQSCRLFLFPNCGIEAPFCVLQNLVPSHTARSL